MLFWTLKLKLEAKIKSTPPQSSPALRAREEARATATKKQDQDG
jgi:hypothetical protein